MKIYTVTVAHAYDSPFDYEPRTASFTHRECAEQYVQQLVNLFKEADCDRFCVSVDSGELDSMHYLEFFKNELASELTEEDLKELEVW